LISASCSGFGIMTTIAALIPDCFAFSGEGGFDRAAGQGRGMKEEL
jgi:hypothetical protein